MLIIFCRAAQLATDRLTPLRRGGARPRACEPNLSESQTKRTLMANGIRQEVTFKASPKRVYDALLDSKQFSEFSGGAPAEIDSKAGGAFSCFGGMITGRSVELIPNQRIVQAWRAGDWPEGVYSIVKLDLKAQGSDAKLTLHHAGFPEKNAEHLKEGWHKMYWEPLKKYLA
jgi:activator of HSP90 ATPase